MNADDLRALLKRARMTQREAAELCGVTLRTVQNWVSGGSPVPVLAAQALMAEEAARDDLAFERETSADPQTLAFIAKEQERRIAELERQLAAERAALSETRALMQEI